MNLHTLAGSNKSKAVQAAINTVTAMLGWLFKTMNPFEVGLLYGIIHHFALQYPYQSEILKTLFAVAVSNILYSVRWLISGGGGSPFVSLVGCLLRDLIIFNCVSVMLS
jgi:hypothetical protein